MEPNRYTDENNDQPDDGVKREVDQVREPVPTYSDTQQSQQPEAEIVDTQTPVRALETVVADSIVPEPQDLNTLNPTLVAASLANFAPNPLPSDVPTVAPPVAVASDVRAASPKKKSMMWLWVTLGIVLLVIIALVASFFVVKNAGDAVAKTYTTNAQTYLDKVYDTSTSAATDPGKIQKDIDAIKAPVLESTLMGGMSSDYVTAEKLNTEVTKRVTALTDTMKENAEVYTFYTDYKAFYAELRALDTKGVTAVLLKSKSGVATYMNDFNDKLKEVKAFIDDATVPADLESDLKELSRVYGTMSTSWNSMNSAFESNNSAAYTASFDNFKAASGEIETVKKPIETYFNDLSDKTKDAAKELQMYRDTLK